MDIGGIIRDIRIRSLLSQADFAKEIGVSFSTVNRWENGKAKNTVHEHEKVHATYTVFQTDSEKYVRLDIYGWYRKRKS